MFVRKEYSIDDNNLYTNNSTTIFEDNKKKYLVDPFNNLIKDELKYHHNIRMYGTAQFNKYKIISDDMKDKIMYKKGILKDTLVCTRPLPNPDNEIIKFNIKVFGINLNDLESNLKVDLVLDENISFENVINQTIKFEIKDCVLFQNTNVLFVELIHNDLKFLVIYDLINQVLLKNEDNTVVKIEHQTVLYFENDNKKRVFGIINNNVFKKYKIKTNQYDLMYLKDMSVMVDLPLSKGHYFKDELFVFVDHQDENKLVIFDFDFVKQPALYYFLKAENNKTYNVSISNNKNMIITTSTTGTNIKLFVKNKEFKYELIRTFKRGMQSTLNYLIGFSNDDTLVYSLSYNRTLHLYGLDDIRSLYVLKLKSRIMDDVCVIKVMRDFNTNKYYIYVMWKYNGNIEMYLFDRQIMKCKRVDYVELY